MLGVEFDMNIAMEVEREEVRDAERKKIAIKALAKGASIEFVKEITGFDDETIRRLQGAVNNANT